MGKQPYQYKESGLDNVFLENGYRIEEDGSIFIEDINGLHTAIAEKLVFAPRKLKGREIRYIRHYLDLSQKTLGEILGVDYQTVLRWETSKNKITNTAERFLRGLLYEVVNKNARFIEVMDTLSDLDNDREPQQIDFSHEETGWKQAA